MIDEKSEQKNPNSNEGCRSKKENKVSDKVIKEGETSEDQQKESSSLDYTIIIIYTCAVIAMIGLCYIIRSYCCCYFQRKNKDKIEDLKNLSGHN